MKLAGLAVLAFLSCTPGLTAPVSSRAKDGARILYLEGSVVIRGQGAERKAAQDAVVREGESVITSKDSFAIVELADGSRVKLDMASEVSLDQLASRANGGSTELQLKRGAVFSRVQKLKPGSTFRVRSKGAVMGVRGTEFFAALSEPGARGQDLWMCVNEGEVEIQGKEHASRAIVRKGEGVFVRGGDQVTAPKPYSWTRGLNWKMDPAAGDVRNSAKIDEDYRDEN